MTRVSVIGGSGYIGGELIRLLLQHPSVTLAEVSSDTNAGGSVASVHPNLRGHTALRFVRHEKVGACDILFLAMPHGHLHKAIGRFEALAPLLIDLSADFRVNDPQLFKRYYSEKHQAVARLPQFVPGLPEFHADRLAEADRISVPGCMANASILAIFPLTQAGLLGEQLFIEAKAGSSGAGTKLSRRSHHPERSGAIRIAKPSGHRHEGEISYHCGVNARLTTCSTDAVRGVHVTIFCTLSEGVTTGDITNAYRRAYGQSPFARMISARNGPHNLPEPKLLTGTNYCDIGFVVGPDPSALVLFSALDNLVKGGSGNAVQCMNIAKGWDQATGLGFPGLHPI